MMDGSSTSSDNCSMQATWKIGNSTGRSVGPTRFRCQPDTFQCPSGQAGQVCRNGSHPKIHQRREKKTECQVPRTDGTSRKTLPERPSMSRVKTGKGGSKVNVNEAASRVGNQ